MITGRVTASREAVISLKVRGPDGTEREIEAVVDTGFSGSLTLPSALIEILDLEWRQRGQAVLADGTRSLFDVYDATIVWDGKPRPVAADAVDGDPLIGMSLVFGHDLTIEGVVGGNVVIKARPRPKSPARKAESSPRR